MPTEMGLFKRKPSLKPVIEIFASSDPQVNNHVNPKSDIMPAKVGHISTITTLNKEAVSQGHATGFVCAGDLTNAATSGRWWEFEHTNELKVFRQRIVKPLEKENLAVFLGLGNHDTHPETNISVALKGVVSVFNKIALPIASIGGATSFEIRPPVFHRKAVRTYINERYGHELYYAALGDINIVCLSVYPDAKALEWMKENVPDDKPIVVFWHYNVKGHYSVEGSNEVWWTKAERKKAFDVFQNDYTTLAVIVGHYHASAQYTHRGIPVYLTGGAQFLHLTIDPNQNFNVAAQLKSPVIEENEPEISDSEAARACFPCC